MSEANPMKGDYVQMDEVGWAQFPAHLCKGDIKFKLLHVSPERGGWTAIYSCKAGSSFLPHIHLGPSEYFLLKGRMQVRGGEAAGGATAVAPGYAYEVCDVHHDHTEFDEDSELLMIVYGALNYVDDEGNTTALIGPSQMLDFWNASR